MAPPHNQPSKVRSSLPFPLSTEHRRRRCSKAQMCFFKILHIISVFPTVDVTDNNCPTHHEEISENKGFGVDLDIILRPPTKIEPLETAATVNGDDVGKNCVFEKNDRSKSESYVAEESELAVEEERATEHSEISHVGDQSSGIDYNGVSEVVVEEEQQRDEGYLGLLIEAAQLILGDEAALEKKPPARSKYVEASAAARGGAKRKQQCWTAAAEAEWYAEFEDTSPVVKSKRGRNQVLPYKYRDSVVEPLVRWPSSRHRSISNSAVPSKRRSK